MVAFAAGTRIATVGALFDTASDASSVAPFSNRTRVKFAGAAIENKNSVDDRSPLRLPQGSTKLKFRSKQNCDVVPASTARQYAPLALLVEDLLPVKYWIGSSDPDVPSRRTVPLINTWRLGASLALLS